MLELRKRSDLDANFDELLVQFLDDRNMFVHDIDGVPDFDIRSEAGIKAAHQFLKRLINGAEEILKIFTALTYAWTQEAKFDVPFPADQPIFEEIVSEYRPRVDHLFFSKTDDEG
jgi:hypothetical protein